MGTPKQSAATPNSKPEGITVSELAARLEADPRDLRKWLRAEGMGLGERGKRYVFDSKQATALSRKWKAAQKQPEAKDAS
jgi:phage antirepressor YoqD-like protein